MNDNNTSIKPTRVNRLSDHDFLLALAYLNQQGQTEYGFPPYDWEIKFYTSSPLNFYTVSCRGGVMLNCQREGDMIRVIMDGHKLSTGILRARSTIYIPDSNFPDGTRRVVDEHEFKIIFVSGHGTLASGPQLELLFPYVKGDKGDPFTYADFTAQQIAGLRKPADDAAKDLQGIKDTFDADEKARAKAETNRATAEQTRADNEGKRISAETARETAEKLRQQAESARDVNEQKRQQTEAVRTANETSRQQVETTRASAETARSNAEQTRVDNETSRTSAEATRAANETARSTAEQTRASNETSRKSAETARAANETARATAEQSRVEAEQQRVEAEQSRVEAEQSRAREFAGFAQALDKGTIKCFIDKWDAAWKVNDVVYGKYDPDNAPDTAHPFLGNKIWMTYEEALTVYERTNIQGLQYSGNNFQYLYRFYLESKIRTTLPIKVPQAAGGSIDASGMFYNCYNLETFMCYMPDVAAEWTIIYVDNCDGMFFGCRKLREILTPIRLKTRPITFPSCKALEWVVFWQLSQNVDLRDSPLIRTDALAETIAKAPNGSSGVTITLHPDAYARVTDDIFAAAAAKNITIATP